MISMRCLAVPPALWSGNSALLQPTPRPPLTPLPPSTYIHTAASRFNAATAILYEAVKYHRNVSAPSTRVVHELQRFNWVQFVP